MSRLFETTTLKGMTLKNRFVRSATWEGMAAEDGSSTPQLQELMVRLAQGDIGLIISSYAYVLAEGKARIGQLGIYKDEHIVGLRAIVEDAHRYGSRIAAQLVHCGVFSDAELTGRVALGPSHVPDLVDTPHEEMSTGDIEDMVAAFGRAAHRAKEAGFDAVQIHAAHGYLHSQFLSPAFNRRTDAYGGSVENRARVVLETLKAIRDAVGPDFPILIKMNCRDFLDEGQTLEESLQVGALLEPHGIDAVELSGGTVISGKLGPVRAGIKTEEQEAYFRKEAKAFKERLGVPLILVGGIRSLETAAWLLDDGYADYISICRPFVREPDLIKRWAAGDRRKSTCISDGLCRDAAFSGDGIHCVVAKREEA
jgi:2,4-dienoyl-CoA reductase-like NADH-dependent reductase (Old Yellow Enzyme family)